jgi:hypothetical protein
MTDCLKLLPEQRPSLDELRYRTSVGIKNSIARADGPFSRYDGSKARFKSLTDTMKVDATHLERQTIT